MRTTFISIITLLFFVTPAAYAHKFSTAYLDISEKEAEIQLLFKVAIHDLASANLLSEQANQISWKQITASYESIAHYIDSHVKLNSEGKPCALVLLPATTWQVQHIQQQPYVLLQITADCSNNPLVQLSYNALFETGHSHKLLLSWNINNLKVNAVLAENERIFPHVKD